MNNMYDILSKFDSVEKDLLQEAADQAADQARAKRFDDSDRKRERHQRATDHKTLDRLERQAVDRAKQIGESNEQLDEISSDLAQQAADKARAKGKEANSVSELGKGRQYMQQAGRLQQAADRRKTKEVQAGFSPAKQRRMQSENNSYMIDEEDMEEGNEFSGALAKARAAGDKEFEVGGRTYAVTEGKHDPHPLDDPLTRFRKKHAPSVMKDPESRKEMEKLDSEHEERKKTGYGRGEDEDDEDEDDGKKKTKPAGEKRGRGRPKGSKRAIGAKGPTGKSKLLKMKEDSTENPKITAYHKVMNMIDSLKHEQQVAGASKAIVNFRMKFPQADEMAKELASSLDDKKRTMQFFSEDYDRDEYDEEGEMAKTDARTIEDAAEELQSILDDDENLPEWVQKKISLAKDYVDRARDYMKANRPEHDMAMAEGSTGDYSAKKARAGKDIGKPGKNFDKIADKAGKKYGSKAAGDRVAGAILARLRAKESAGEEKLDEKFASQAQARLMHATAGGADTGVSKKVAREFIKKSHGQRVGKLPEKVKKQESVEETTTAGSVATSAAEPKSSKKGGMQYGKGVYESRLEEQFRRHMNTLMNESLDVSVTANADGTNSVSVTGKDVAPDVLVDLLKMAGMSGSREQVYHPMDSFQDQPSQEHDLRHMLKTLGGIDHEQQHEQEPTMEIIPEDDEICEECGCAGMHEATCSHGEVMEDDLANSAGNTETMSADYMLNDLAGGLNRPKRQINPNNLADNPLSMSRLSGHKGAQVNLGDVTESIEQQDYQRMLDLYKRIS